MKISDIKKLKGLQEISENWYHRTKKLAYVIHDDNAVPDKRLKAFMLWKIMSNRLLQVASVINETRIQTIPKFASGSDHKDNPLTRKNSGLSCPNNFSL
jgi:hypothetical protein